MEPPLNQTASRKEDGHSQNEPQNCQPPVLTCWVISSAQPAQVQCQALGREVINQQKLCVSACVRSPLPQGPARFPASAPHPLSPYSDPLPSPHCLSPSFATSFDNCLTTG